MKRHLFARASGVFLFKSTLVFLLEIAIFEGWKETLADDQSH